MLLQNFHIVNGYKWPNLLSKKFGIGQNQGKVCESQEMLERILG